MLPVENMAWHKAENTHHLYNWQKDYIDIAVYIFSMF